MPLTRLLRSDAQGHHSAWFEDRIYLASRVEIIGHNASRVEPHACGIENLNGFGVDTASPRARKDLSLHGGCC